MAETLNAICKVCGQPYGNCDMAVHRREIKKTDPRYDFDSEKTTETRWHDASISPKASELRVNEAGEKVADVNVVTFKTK